MQAMNVHTKATGNTATKYKQKKKCLRRDYVLYMTDKKTSEHEQNKTKNL